MDPAAAVQGLLRGDEGAASWLVDNAQLPAVAEAVLASGALDSLLQRLDSAQALHALSVLALIRQPAVLGCVCSRARQLVEALAGAAEPGVRLGALQCLVALSTHSVTKHLVAMGVIEPVRRLLAVGSHEAAYHALLLLTNVCDAQPNRLEICRGGALLAVADVVLSPTRPAEVKEAAVDAARALARVNAAGEVPDIFPAVLAHIAQSEAPEARDAGVRALALLARQPELRGRLSQVPGLLAALRAAPEELRPLAQEALEGLQEPSLEALRAVVGLDELAPPPAPAPEAGASASPSSAATAGGGESKKKKKKKKKKKN